MEESYRANCPAFYGCIAFTVTAIQRISLYNRR